MVIVLLAALSVVAPTAQAGFGNFRYSGRYKTGQYSDVKGTEWFARHIEDAYNYGFFTWETSKTFRPERTLKLSEAVRLLAVLSGVYDSGKAYSVDYASYGNAEVTRAAFAELAYGALPSEAFAQINDVPEFGIIDITPDMAYGDAVYALYRAGVLTGVDRYGSFRPDTSITRAEACVMLVRMAKPAARVGFKLPERIPANTIYMRSLNAVFMIETYDWFGDTVRTGTGFFISADGLCATNLHVIEGAPYARVILQNGRVYDLTEIVASSSEYNLAIFTIGTGAGTRRFSYLRLADSDAIEAGNTVYTIGSPLELMNSMTEGIVAHTGRSVSGGNTLITFTAPISFGSGGSPLLNTLGQVIGVASSSYTYGQNLNLAVPVNQLREVYKGLFEEPPEETPEETPEEMPEETPEEASP
jgi:S1-C subfamily serine protease